MIVETPGVCGGRPRIDGHRIEVGFIARLVELNYTVDTILNAYPQLTRTEVLEAIAYAATNKDTARFGRAPSR